jgi:hypothetical protein
MSKCVGEEEEKEIKENIKGSFCETKKKKREHIFSSLIFIFIDPPAVLFYLRINYHPFRN